MTQTRTRRFPCEQSDPTPFSDWARVYDTVYADRTADVPFYREECGRADGPVLEVGCGTGRIYLEVRDAGVDAYGLDSSACMLSVLAEKAADRGLDAAVWCGDMRRLAFDETLEVVTIPFNAFLHNLRTDDQLATLRAVRSHLAPGGRLVLDFALPNPEMFVEPIEHDYAVTVDGEEYTVAQRYAVAERVEGVVDITRHLLRDGERVASTGYQYARLGKSEFELLLQAAGFDDWRVYGGFDREPVSDDATHLVWVVEA
jgi:SAM-dependent methyltransferase